MNDQDLQVIYDSCTEEDKLRVDDLMNSGLSLYEALAEIGCCL